MKRVRERGGRKERKKRAPFLFSRLSSKSVVGIGEREKTLLSFLDYKTHDDHLPRAVRAPLRGRQGRRLPVGRPKGHRVRLGERGRLSRRGQDFAGETEDREEREWTPSFFFLVLFSFIALPSAVIER